MTGLCRTTGNWTSSSGLRLLDYGRSFPRIHFIVLAPGQWFVWTLLHTVTYCMLEIVIKRTIGIHGDLNYTASTTRPLPFAQQNNIT